MSVKLSLDIISLMLLTQALVTLNWLCRVKFTIICCQCYVRLYVNRSEFTGIINIIPFTFFIIIAV